MTKLNVLDFGQEYVDNGICILKYVCPSHNKDTVKIQGGEDWITVEFTETDLMTAKSFNYSTKAPVKAIHCKFTDGILSVEIQFKIPEPKKLNVVFD